jgi:hypothetical protein
MIRKYIVPALLRYLFPALLLLALGLFIRPVFSQQTTLQNVAICYAVDGSTIETTYVNVPASGAYPIETSGSVEAIEGGFVTHHSVRFEFRIYRMFLPGVTR